MAQILIFYSNPLSTQRIRLDREHRIMDEVKARFGNESDAILRCHAVTLDDLTRSLSEKSYDVIQFSGHGSKQGILLEDESFQKPVEVPPEQVAAIIKRTQPRLKLAIFMSCYSAEAISSLIDVAPYLIAVSGEADDDGAIDFIRVFYETYFQSSSVEKAFDVAKISISQKTDIAVELFRRFKEQKGDSSRYHVLILEMEDSIIIDHSEADKDIDRLGMSREAFLSILSRKLKVHKRLFENPREKTVIPIGHLYGVFSWQDANDVVICHRVLKMKDETMDTVCDAWNQMVLDYNDAVGYRSIWSSAPADPKNARALKKSLETYFSMFNTYFEKEPYSPALRSCLPARYKQVRSYIKANLTKADSKLAQDDYSNAIQYLEAVLSTIHDFLNDLTESVTD
jgi:hypothetical protein